MRLLKSYIQEKIVERKIFFSISVFAPLSLICALLIYPFIVADADNGQGGISVNPMLQNIDIDIDNASENKTFPIDVSNTTESPVSLHLSVVDFGSLDESGGVAFLGTKQNSAKEDAFASWARLNHDVLVIEPGSTKQVHVTIENKESLAPGGHYGAVMFDVISGDKADNDTSENVAVKQSFASLIFVKKIGGEIYDLNIEDVNFKKNFVLLPRAFDLIFQNKGNVHTAPHGLVTISDSFGKIIQKGIINQESSVILPETSRTYTVKTDAVSNSYVPGVYTVSLSYRYDDQDEVKTHEIRFLYIPTMYFGGIFLIVIGVFAYRKYGKKQK